jgi:transcriptional regulator with XRE-family HTH domain
MVKRQKDNQEIGRRIKFYRLKSGLTQQQMAVKLGIAQGQISDYEAGKVSVPIDLLGYMADMLSVPILMLDDSLSEIPFFKDGLANCKKPEDWENELCESLECFRRRLMDSVMESDIDPVAKSKTYQLIKNLPLTE